MARFGRMLRGLAVAASLAGFAAAAAEFVPGVDDLPLMPGLEANAAASTAFETPTGRIVEAEAQGRGVSEAEVRRFYAGTLPALGWKRVDDRHYERAGERLSLGFAQRQGQLVVRFDIRPR